MAFEMRIVWCATAKKKQNRDISQFWQWSWYFPVYKTWRCVCVTYLGWPDKAAFQIGVNILCKTIPMLICIRNNYTWLKIILHSMTCHYSVPACFGLNNLAGKGTGFLCLFGFVSFYSLNVQFTVYHKFFGYQYKQAGLRRTGDPYGKSRRRITWPQFVTNREKWWQLAVFGNFLGTYF